MLFFFKEKPIEVVALCRSHQRYAFEYAPVRQARDMFPQWWRDTESSGFDWETLSQVVTSKSCVGIINQVSTGLIFPMWCDLAIKWDKDSYQYKYSDDFSRMDGHNLSNTEAPGFLLDHFILKLISPWMIRSKIKHQYLFPFYHHTTSPNFNLAPGIVTPQKGYSACNLFLCLRKTDILQNLFIKNNTPMMQAVPLTDKKVIYRVEVMSKKEENLLDNTAGAPNFFSAAGLKKIFFEQQNK